MRALARWQAAGTAVAIYSSGSVRAQQMLFAHTQAGDLTPRLSAYFDTTTGFKTEPDSYRRIAAALGHEPGAILFVSDVGAELDAAQAAGMQTALCARSDTLPLVGRTGWSPASTSFSRGRRDEPRVQSAPMRPAGAPPCRRARDSLPRARSRHARPRTRS